MAVSSVLAKLGSHCFDANATVAVPNSLGPGELLVRYGTDEQRGYFLPRLADGTLIPCFGLTGPHSGSDATSLIGSYGTVEKRNGVLGVRCTFEKRYITLAPVAGVVGILLIAGARRRYLLMITGLAIVTMGTVIINGFIGKYQLRRFVSWLNQDSRDKALESVVLQVRFAKRAVSTGGFFGKGYLDGPLTNGKFIPVQFTDFPFSAIAEQFGMLGGGVVIGLFAVMLWRIWRIAQMARDRFGLYLTCGIFTLLMFQIFQNIGMTLGLTPVSGLPLPFVSYGGSHMVSTGIMVGLVQSVHMRRLE
jgi:hypothetical protein